MKILCDQMLGTLAKWLRLLGFDTYYAGMSMKDEDLMAIAQRENRCFITRDKLLVQRVKRRDIPVIHIQTTNLEEQLHRVLKDKPLDETLFLSRCSVCNTPLENINKEEVEDKVPEKVYAHQEIFWKCPGCQKIYWKGSHFDNIIKKINDLQRK
jgi:uncharacterized protein with PIN domain